MAEVKTKASDIRKRQKEAAERKPKPFTPRVKRQTRAPRQPVAPPPDEDEEDEEVETEIVQADEGPDISTWPTRAEAARRIGVNKRTIMRWQKDGDLEAVVDQNGFFRFNPEDIDELAASRTGEAAQMMGQSVAMVVSTSTELTGKAQQHAQAFADKHLEQSDIAFARLTAMTDSAIEENKSLRAYIRELESDRREARKEIEAAESKVHERKLKELEVTTHERRIDWAMGTLLSLAGPSIAKKMGLDIGAIAPMPGASPMTANAMASLQAPSTEGIAAPSTNGASPGRTVTGAGPIGVGDPATKQDLLDLETNTILLIGNIEEPRLKLLCSMAQPHESAALQEIWSTVDRLRKQAASAEKQNG
jgi:DNA-binding transcriptional MerR regulator